MADWFDKLVPFPQRGPSQGLFCWGSLTGGDTQELALGGRRCSRKIYPFHQATRTGSAPSDSSVTLITKIGKESPLLGAISGDFDKGRQMIWLDICVLSAQLGSPWFRLQPRRPLAERVWSRIDAFCSLTAQRGRAWFRLAGGADIHENAVPWGEGLHRPNYNIWLKVDLKTMILSLDVHCCF